jgi:hypothetical protein
VGTRAYKDMQRWFRFSKRFALESTLICSTRVLDSGSSMGILLHREEQSAVVAPSLNANVQALTGIIVVLSVVIFGLIGWRIYVWRSNVKRARHTIIRNELPKEEKTFWGDTSTVAGTDLEKGSPPVTPPSDDGRWQPQTRYQTFGPSTSTVSTLQAPKKPATLLLANQTRSIATPPPSYRIDRSPSATSQGPATPPAAATRTARVGTMLSPQPTQNDGFLTVNKSFFDHITPSPRTASFPNKSPSSSASHVTQFGTPQQMIVVTTFEPTCEDELKLHIGEELQLIHEYEDTWCLVGRVSKNETTEGMVPRFCLQERSKVVAPI